MAFVARRAHACSSLCASQVARGSGPSAVFDNIEQRRVSFLTPALLSVTFLPALNFATKRWRLFESLDDSVTSVIKADGHKSCRVTNRPAAASSKKHFARNISDEKLTVLVL